MKKKISIFAYSLGSGGAERQVSYLLQHLHKHYDVTLVLMNSTIFYTIPKQIKVHYLEKSAIYENGFIKLFKLPLLAWKYKKLLRAHHIEVSLSFMSRPNYINVLAKLFGSNTYTIISERSMFSLHYNYKNLQSFINKKLVILYRYADFIITNALNNANDLKKNFNITNKMKTIYNAVDVSTIEKLKHETTDIIFPSDTFNFITIGRLDLGKNHTLLVDTIKKSNANLYIIGEGQLKATLEKKIHILGLQNQVFLLGRQNNPYALMSQADCFIFASNHEGMPNVLLEALACGLPIISTDCESGPREILAPNTKLHKILTNKIELAEYGILTPIKNEHCMLEAIEEMIVNQGIRNNYILKSPSRACEFSIDIMVQHFIDIIEKVHIETASDKEPKVQT